MQDAVIDGRGLGARDRVRGSAQIARVARERAAGQLEPYAVAALEDVRQVRQEKADADYLTTRHLGRCKPRDLVGQVTRAPALVDIAQPGEDVGGGTPGSGYPADCSAVGLRRE